MLTKTLVQHVHQISWGNLPSAIQNRTIDLLIDHIAVTLNGATQPWSKMVRMNAESEMGEPQSTVYGYGALPARAAALVNGCAAHAIEFDDTHDESLGHPGAVVMTTAMAMGEALNSEGSEILEAIVAGYEIQCRVGAAAGRQAFESGFHPTSTVGVFGAVTAAGRLLNLSTDQLEKAFGIALSTASGTLQFSEDPLNTMVKRLHAALPAANGIWAAQLASRGFTGPSMALEGNFGYVNQFSNDVNLNRITQDLGSQWEIGRISIKLYPCCKQFHALIDATRICLSREKFNVADIESIEAFGPESMFDSHMERRPQSTMAAQYSLPFTAAVAVASDPTDPNSFSESQWSREDILRLSDLVTTRVDARLQDVYPRKFAGGIMIRLKDGREISEAVIDSRSSPENPIPREEVIVKFKTLTQTILDDSQRDQILKAILAQNHDGTPRLLGSKLRGILSSEVA